MALTKQSFHSLSNLDATGDTRYPLGDKPFIQPVTLGVDLVGFNAAQIDFTNITRGNAQTVNYRQFLTGTSAATATLSVNAVTGVIGGWAISGDVLVNTASTIGNGSINVIASDGSGNTVTFPVQIWAIVPPPALQFKWAPQVSWIVSNIQGGSSIASDLASANQILPRSTNSKMVTVYKTWAQLENPQLVGGAAQYDGSWDANGNSGFKGIDKLIAGLPAGTKVKVYFYNSSTSGGTTFPSGLAPAYLNSTTYGQISGIFYGGCVRDSVHVDASGNKSSKGSIVRYWAAPVMARLTALLQAYGAKYNGNSQFYLMDPFSEITGITWADYSDNTFIASLNSTNIAQLARAAFPNTMLRVMPTYIGNYSNYKTILDIFKAAHWCVGEFDSTNRTDPAGGNRARDVAGAKAFRGISPITNLPDSNLTDYRNTWDYHCQICGDELGPRSNAATLPPAYGTGVMSDIWGGIAIMNASHVDVLNDSWTGPPQNKIGTGYHPDLVDSINAQTIPRTSYPTMFP